MDKEAIIIHKSEEFEYMRRAGRLAAEVLDMIGDYIVAGVTTEKLNDLCHEMIISNNAVPAPLNYRGFPKSICTSVNHVVCHGIPSEKILKEGDIVNIDVTVILDGWHGDSSRTYWVGEVPIKARRLTEITYQAMVIGIEQVKPGATIGDIGAAIQQFVESNNYSVVRDYCGHGIGRDFHSAPNILHFGEAKTGIPLKEGMFFTVEPMVNIGKAETILSQIDNWTVTTRDKSLSAQFEHSIAVTESGYEIFTASPTGKYHPNF